MKWDGLSYCKKVWYTYEVFCFYRNQWVNESPTIGMKSDDKD